jgi:hypothetical protein
MPRVGTKFHNPNKGWYNSPARDDVIASCNGSQRFLLGGVAFAFHKSGCHHQWVMELHTTHYEAMFDSSQAVEGASAGHNAGLVITPFQDS